MKITFATSYNPRDVSNWSGIPYHIAHFLEQEPEVNLRCFGQPVEWAQRLRKLQHFLGRKLLGKNLPHDRAYWLTPMLGKAVSQELKAHPADVLLTIGTALLPYVRTEAKKVIWTDTTAASLIGFYDYFDNFSPKSLEMLHELEARAFRKADLLLFSSEWAAQSAIQDYQMPAEKVKVVGFGANFLEIPQSEAVLESIRQRPTEKITLLFLGVYWERKGGDKAVAAARALHQAGYPVELLLVGSAPLDAQNLPDYIKPLGFISKATSEGRKKLNQLLLDSHFLIIPTEADCTPIAFCEANAYGLPCLSNDVGGVASVITDGENGRLFPLSSNGEDYAEYIKEVWKSGSYTQLAERALKAYQERLNWQVNIRQAIRLMQELV